MNNTNKITPTFLSYAGGGQPNFSAVGRKQQFPQSNSANSAVGKKLSIVNCALLILFCLLFAGSLSAQDNYTVVVKCYPTATNGTGTISAVEWTWTANPYYKYGCDYKTQSGNIEVSYNRTTKNTAGTSSYNHGWVIFNISGIPSRNATIAQPPTMYLWPVDSYNSSGFNLVFGHNTSYDVVFPTTSSYSSTSAGWPPSGGTAFSQFAAVIGTYGLGGGTFYSSNSGTYNPFVLINGLGGSLTESRASGKESFMVRISGGYGTTTSVFKAYGANNASRKPFLAVCYAAPWSVTQSVQTPATSVCANSRFSLSAGATIQNDITCTPVSWQWYSATASNGVYSSMGGTNQSTYAVTAPSNTGSVWYKFYRTINMITDAVNSATSSYAFTNCNPASVYVSQCCTPINSNNPPSFSASCSVSDRSVTLNWNNLGTNVDHYVIHYGVDGGLSFKEITVAGTASSTRIDHLTNGRRYYFQIKAIGKSGYCDSRDFSTTYLVPACQ